MWFQWVGGVLLVGSMVLLSAKEMRRVRVALSTVQAWKAFLDGVRHSVSAAGMPLSAVLVPLREDIALQSALLGGRRPKENEASCARSFLRHLSREAATLLPAEEEATKMLSRLGEVFDEARDTEEIVRQLEKLLHALTSLQSRLADRESRECRARGALYICGALCAVLMLW